MCNPQNSLFVGDKLVEEVELYQVTVAGELCMCVCVHYLWPRDTCSRMASFVHIHVSIIVTFQYISHLVQQRLSME